MYIGERLILLHSESFPLFVYETDGNMKSNTIYTPTLFGHFQFGAVAVKNRFMKLFYEVKCYKNA